MSAKKTTGKKSLAKGRPAPNIQKAGYSSNKKRYGEGGKIKKKSS